MYVYVGALVRKATKSYVVCEAEQICYRNSQVLKRRRTMFVHEVSQL